MSWKQTASNLLFFFPDKKKKKTGRFKNGGDREGGTRSASGKAEERVNRSRYPTQLWTIWSLAICHPYASYEATLEKHVNIFVFPPFFCVFLNEVISNSKRHGRIFVKRHGKFEEHKNRTGSLMTSREKKKRTCGFHRNLSQLKQKKKGFSKRDVSLFPSISDIRRKKKGGGEQKKKKKESTDCRRNGSHFGKPLDRWKIKKQSQGKSDCKFVHRCVLTTARWLLKTVQIGLNSRQSTRVRRLSGSFFSCFCFIFIFFIVWAGEVLFF